MFSIDCGSLSGIEVPSGRAIASGGLRRAVSASHEGRPLSVRPPTPGSSLLPLLNFS